MHLTVELSMFLIWSISYRAINKCTIKKGKQSCLRSHNGVVGHCWSLFFLHCCTVVAEWWIAWWRCVRVTSSVTVTAPLTLGSASLSCHHGPVIGSWAHQFTARNREVKKHPKFLPQLLLLECKHWIVEAGKFMSFTWYTKKTIYLVNYGGSFLYQPVSQGTRSNIQYKIIQIDIVYCLQQSSLSEKKKLS